MGGGREGKVASGSRGTTRIPRTVVFGELLRNTRPRGPALRVFSLYAFFYRAIITLCED